MNRKSILVFFTAMLALSLLGCTPGVKTASAGTQAASSYFTLNAANSIPDCTMLRKLEQMEMVSGCSYLGTAELHGAAVWSTPELPLSSALVEGMLPKTGECAVSASFAQKNRKKVGDTVLAGAYRLRISGIYGQNSGSLSAVFSGAVQSFWVTPEQLDAFVQAGAAGGWEISWISLFPGASAYDFLIQAQQNGLSKLASLTKIDTLCGVTPISL